MRTVDKFERYGQKIYNGQDVLKNHILKKYPIHLTDDTNDYNVVSQYTDDYVWLVDKNIKTLPTFPWFFKPTEVAVHKFPYVYKASTRIKSWDAVKLVPTKVNTDKVIEHKYICGVYDFYNDKVSFDIFFIGNKSTGTWDSLIKKFPNATYVESYHEAAELSTTDMFWLVPDDVEITAWFRFSYQPDDWSHEFSHVFRNGSTDSRDGIVLFPKNYKPTANELKYRYYSNKKEMQIIASNPLEYEKFTFKNYKEYLNALENSKTEMFWHIPDDVVIKKYFKFDVYFSHQNQYDRNINHVYLNNKTYDGIVLFSKNSPVTEKEFNTRFYINKKEWDTVASVPKPFDLFNIDTYDDYKLALEKTTTEMFWMSSANLKYDSDLVNNFYISHHELQLRRQTHAFKHKVENETTYNGVFLCSKNVLLTTQEIEYRFPITRIEHDTIVSGPVIYDTFVVDSYDEYVYALANSKTEMFWATSCNISTDDFKFDLYFTHDNEYDRKQNHAFIHRVNDENYYNGVFLFSKHKPVTQKEIEHRFIADCKEWDIVASNPIEYDTFVVDSYNDYQAALENSKTEMFWAVSANIKIDPAFNFNLYVSHDNYDRKQNHAFIHRVNDENYYNGVFLFSKHKPVTQKEIEHRFIADCKEWDIIASGPIEYDTFVVDSYNEYVYALETSKTEMFWATSCNISTDDFKFDLYFTHNNDYDRKQNHAFIHRVNDEDHYNGVFLFSKHKPVTQKEIEHRFIADCKEWNVVASGPCKYEKFYPKTYNEYLTALENSKTEMFWIIPEYVNVTDRFKFDTYFSHNQSFERNINHAYLNGKYYDGVVLCSKYAKFTEREFDYKFIANKKEVPVIISTPKLFDVVFISYQEPNCEENYEKLLTKIPYAKRIHGVKGIHQAHIAAAKLCNTDMFWIVDGDAEIMDDFDFNHQVARWDKEIVHVWRSQNPINDLVYGYGGVKLFPRDLTINMDITKPDMTTSISSKFKAISQISNITGFNTDPFNTWKSAFRECCKLSSKIIDRQKEDETNTRLRTWCTLGEDKLYGNYSIAGAKAGAFYGARNKDNVEALSKINDFEWLQKQFTQSSQLI
jgi:predicted transcriptional regulator